MISFLFCDMSSLIDDGKNPDEFTKDVLNECIAKNQITKGKADAFKVSFFTPSFSFNTSSFESVNDSSNPSIVSGASFLSLIGLNLIVDFRHSSTGQKGTPFTYSVLNKRIA